MQDVLFVCTGNTCRSPMAEAIANDVFEKNKLQYKAFSRGINVILPSRASENSIKALRFLYNIELDTHISRQIKEEDIEKADIILCMSQSHKNYLDTVFGNAKEKTFTLYGYIGAQEKDIKDPYYEDLAVYKACAEELNNAIHRIFLR